MLTINGNRVPTDKLVIEPHFLTANITLDDGRNDVSLVAIDMWGRSLFYEATLWAGDNTVTVSLVNSNGTPFTTQTNVIASLGDNQSVAARTVTSNGIATLMNVPSRTIMISARGANNELGSAAIAGTQRSVIIPMRGFNPPVAIKNHDFSRGTEGWISSPGARIELIPHVAEIPGFPRSARSVRSAITPMAQKRDFSIGTRGEGEQSTSYTFTTEPGTTAVRIRYRFITSEIPAGYYGSEFNDSFRVSIRSQVGDHAYEANAMNGLGRAAFNDAGETDWRELILIVERSGDTVEFNISVTNVGDNLYDSQVVINIIEEIKDQVRTELAWNPRQGGVDLTWEVLRSPLTEAAIVDVYFAKGTDYEDRLGSRLFRHTIPANTRPGRNTVNIPGQRLAITSPRTARTPEGTTHLIAFNSPNLVGYIADVNITFGERVLGQERIFPELLDVIRGGQRVNGVASVTITSGYRPPSEQARVMFNNL